MKDIYFNTLYTTQKKFEVEGKSTLKQYVKDSGLIIE